MPRHTDVTPRKRESRRTVTWTISVSPEVHAMGGELARLEDEPLSMIIRRLVRQYAEEKGVMPTPAGSKQAGAESTGQHAGPGGKE